MKHLSISIDVWQCLRQIKKEQGFKHVNQVVKWLVEQVYYTDEKTLDGEEEKTNITDDQPVVSNTAIETTVQPVEEARKVGSWLSIDRKTLDKRLQINEDTNLPLDGANPYVNRPRISGTGGRLRQGLYARKHQLFPVEKTVNKPPIRPTVIKCRWCSQIVNITEGDSSRGYIICPFCNGEIRV